MVDPCRPGDSCLMNGRLSLRWRAITNFAAAFVFLLLVSVPGWSQRSTTSLRGTVTGPQAAVVAGAEVVLTDPATAFSRTQKTDDHGAYHFLQIPPGTYTVSVSATGVQLRVNFISPTVKKWLFRIAQETVFGRYFEFKATLQ